MGRQIGIKQDSMVYKTKVFKVKDGESFPVSEYGPYETIGVARQRGSYLTNWYNHHVAMQARYHDVIIDVEYKYEIVTGRIFWFQGEY